MQCPSGRAALPHTPSEGALRPPFILRTLNVTVDHGYKVRIEYKSTNGLPLVLLVLVFNPVKNRFLLYGTKTRLMS